MTEGVGGQPGDEDPAEEPQPAEDHRAGARPARLAAVMARIRPELDDLTAYLPPANDAIVTLDANECPLELSDHARARITDLVESMQLHRYPDPRATKLRALLAARYTADGDPERIVVGTGSDEVISLLLQVFARPATGQTRASVLFPTPTFGMYAVSAAVAGLDAHAVPLGAQFGLDVPSMIAAIERHRPSIIFLASPNNPTGNAFDGDAVRRIVAAATDSLVVIDEAYVAFADASLAPVACENEHVALLGTLSKVGFAGLRIGWASLHPGLAAAVDKVRQPYNVGMLGQALAGLALSELWSEIATAVAEVRSERTRLAAALSAYPCLDVYPSQANFLLVRCRDAAHDLAERLEVERIAVRSFAAPHRLADHVRISVGSRDDNDALLDATARLLD